MFKQLKELNNELNKFVPENTSVNTLFAKQRTSGEITPTDIIATVAIVWGVVRAALLLVKVFTKSEKRYKIDWIIEWGDTFFKR